MKNELQFEFQGSVILKIEKLFSLMSQLQYTNESQNLLSNFVFQFIKKIKWHFRYKDSLAHVFSRKFCEFIRNSFFAEDLKTTASVSLTYTPTY